LSNGAARALDNGRNLTPSLIVGATLVSTMNAKNSGSFGYGGTRQSQVLRTIADLKVRNYD
jgi:hypothetical protein